MSSNTPSQPKNYYYCASCWPADSKEYKDGICKVCGERILAATPAQYISLLNEQNHALAIALEKAMDLLGIKKEQPGKAKKPLLKIVKGEVEK